MGLGSIESENFQAEGFSRPTALMPGASLRLRSIEPRRNEPRSRAARPLAISNGPIEGGWRPESRHDVQKADRQRRREYRKGYPALRHLKGSRPRQYLRAC